MTDDELRRAMGELMGWHLYGPTGLEQWYDSENNLVRSYDGWNPATDANQALRVVEAMEKKGWNCSIDTLNKTVSFWRPIDGALHREFFWASFTVISEITVAICEAAAKAGGA